LRYKLYLILLVVICLAIVAAIRVFPYTQGPKEQPLSSGQKQQLESRSTSVVPEFNVDMLAETVADYSHRLDNKVEEEILLLEHRTRPSPRDSKAISTVFSEFYSFNRTKMLDDALKRYNRMGVEPNRVLVQEDSSRAEKAWAYSTVWAKGEQIHLDSIRVEARYLSGEQVSSPRHEKAALKSRLLSTGNFLVSNAHKFTVYEVILKCTVPSIDGTSTFDVDVCVSIVNDGPRSEWRVLETTWSNLPSGKKFRLPFP